MKWNKNMSLFVLLILLGGLAYYFISTKSSGSSHLANDRKFHIESIDEVHRIFMADRDGNIIDLKKGKGRWTVNDRYEVRPWTITILLATLRDLRIQYIPTEAAVKNMLPDMASLGIKVEIYGKDNQELKTYYVGSMTNDERGTYMMMEGSNDMFVMHIPHWEGSVRARYIMAEVDWRDKTLFREDPDEISKIAVEYPKQKNKSFVLEREGPNYSVSPFYDVNKVNSRKVNQSVAESYFFQFEEVYAEAFENNNPVRDSVINLLPFASIILEKKNGEKVGVRLFPVRKPDKEFQLSTYHMDRYFAERSNGDFMLVQYNLIKNILWPYEQFFNQPE